MLLRFSVLVGVLLPALSAVAQDAPQVWIVPAGEGDEELAAYMAAEFAGMTVVRGLQDAFEAGAPMPEGARVVSLLLIDQGRGVLLGRRQGDDVILEGRIQRRMSRISIAVRALEMLELPLLRRAEAGERTVSGGENGAAGSSGAGGNEGGRGATGTASEGNGTDSNGSVSDDSSNRDGSNDSNDSDDGDGNDGEGAATNDAEDGDANEGNSNDGDGTGNADAANGDEGSALGGGLRLRPLVGAGYAFTFTGEPFTAYHRPAILVGLRVVGARFAGHFQLRSEVFGREESGAAGFTLNTRRTDLAFASGLEVPFARRLWVELLAQVGLSRARASLAGQSGSQSHLAFFAGGAIALGVELGAGFALRLRVSIDGAPRAVGFAVGGEPISREGRLFGTLGAGLLWRGT
ncbi:MAG: hypothetical protein AAF645_17910 [Myxococcota bacterium]